MVSLFWGFEQFYVVRLLVLSVLMCLKSIFLSGCLRSAVVLYRLCPSALLFSQTKGFVHCRPTDHTETIQDV